MEFFSSRTDLLQLFKGMILVKLLFFVIGLSCVQSLTKQKVLLSQLLNFSITVSLKVHPLSVVMI